MSVLAITLLLPLLGFGVLLVLPRDSKFALPVTLGASLAAFLVSLGLIAPAMAKPAQFTSGIDSPWIDGPGIQIHLHMGVDGINLWLILLTTFLVPAGVWISQMLIRDRQKSFYALLMLFEFGLIGVFSALDLFVFYVFWEVALVPMYLMVGSWGGPKRGYAAVKFFVFTMFGSVLMLGSVIYLHSLTGTFDYFEILSGLGSGRVVISNSQSLVIFLGFFAAFAVKAPIFPFHTWLPDAYVESPAPATFLLAAVMSKMGTYGLIRFCLTLFPSGAHRCAGWITILAIIGIIYGALLALIQPNIKRLIAYSSLSHIGFIVLGIFTFSQQGADGAVYQMVAHGLSTGALFVLAGYMEARRGSMEINDFGGVAKPAPGFATAFMIAMLASIGLPMLCNFIGEYLVLQGAAIRNFPWAVFAAIGVILSAAYMLWMYQRTFLGKTNGQTGSFRDLSISEWLPVAPLVVMMLWLGSYTQSFMPAITGATAHLLDQTKMNDEIRVVLRAPGSASAGLKSIVPKRLISAR